MSTTPVHQTPLEDSEDAIPALPIRLTRIHVPIAPAGAARLKTARCALVDLLLRPCLSSTAVSPNAAGALCSIIAAKTTSPRLVFVVGVEVEAPSAIPSATAWMTRPMVVELDCECVVGEHGSGVPRLCRLMCCGGRDGVGPREGSVSMRYIRMKPVIKDRPIQACGDSLCSSASARVLRLRETTEMCKGERSRF